MIRIEIDDRELRAAMLRLPRVSGD